MNRKTVIIAIAVVLVLLLAFAAKILYERSEVATIVDDEAAWDIRDSSPQAKVIIADDGLIARYVSEDETSYTGEIQDTFTVPKENAKVETWYASDGKGIVFLGKPGETAAYATPDTLSGIVWKLEHVEGEIPGTYRVLGYKDGWFSIEIEGNIGYVEAKYVSWDTIDTF